MTYEPQAIYISFRTYRNRGFELVKHDFTTYDILGKWGNQMNDDITSPGWSFNGAEPLDWLHKLCPEKWKLNGQTVSFNWNEV